MLQRNIKQSLTALEIFGKLEEKIYKKELSVVSTYDTNPNCIMYDKFGMIVCVKYEGNSYIDIYLSTDCELKIQSSSFTKSYVQTLSDQEYNDVKERFLKIAQKLQDDFENWLKDADDTNEIDAE